MNILNNPTKNPWSLIKPTSKTFLTYPLYDKINLLLSYRGTVGLPEKLGGTLLLTVAKAVEVVGAAIAAAAFIAGFVTLIPGLVTMHFTSAESSARKKGAYLASLSLRGASYFIQNFRNILNVAPYIRLITANDDDIFHVESKHSSLRVS